MRCRATCSQDRAKRAKDVCLVQYLGCKICPRAARLVHAQNQFGKHGGWGNIGETRCSVSGSDGLQAAPLAPDDTRVFPLLEAQLRYNEKQLDKHRKDEASQSSLLQ